MDPEKPFAGQSAKVVEQAIEVLCVIVGSPDEQLGVREIGRRLGIGRSTTQRILVALRNSEMVTVDESSGTYAPGRRVAELSAPLPHRGNLVTVARRHLEWLWRLTGETVSLSVQAHGMRVTLDKVDSTHELRLSADIGVGSPLYAGAAGRALLAFMPEEERRAYLASVLLTRLTPATVGDVETLARSLLEVRRAGYAISYGERVAGGVAVAAPVIRDGYAVASVSVFAPAQRLEPATAADMALDVIRAAALIEGDLFMRQPAA
ncbi:IclR family transcriptional regulator [Phytohabitans suffuscus]|uniref:Transcriptional regulator n=1 Tax=Phytohabitans suffuscus TaxID=624315 RepID=A0A6F8YUY7_9ACTN|nr:IclR family transcriptional regulator [Phytohabitans suffuscus]BCB89970.1 transcriptional regulator [Phytohabitans suffuscus]